MTITDATTTETTSSRFELVTFDLYKDIHKGIRSELFALTESAGRVDPDDDCGRGDLAAHVAGVHELLEFHAEHEDEVLQPSVELHLPALAERVAVDHLAFERRTARLVDLSASAAAAPVGDRRRLLHWLYLDLASFTSDYLAHQDVEEREIMPGLEQAIGVPAVIGMHEAIIGSLGPDWMARSLALMLPAMNLDDRTEMLGGMQAGAPPEVFEGLWGLAGSILAPRDRDAVAARLGLA